MAAGPPIKEFIKDPDAVKNYTLDWNGSSPGPWLATGETILSTGSSWTSSSTGITIDSSSRTATTASITLSGGTAGEDYDLTNRVVTSNSQIEDATIRIKVLEK